MRDCLDELRYIDSILARRPALADFDNRAAKIEHAISTAAKADKALAEIEKLKNLRVDLYWELIEEAQEMYPPGSSVGRAEILAWLESRVLKSTIS
jgi:hypothetical protein